MSRRFGVPRLKCSRRLPPWCARLAQGLEQRPPTTWRVENYAVTYLYGHMVRFAAPSVAELYEAADMYEARIAREREAKRQRT